MFEFPRKCCLRANTLRHKEHSEPQSTGLCTWGLTNLARLGYTLGVTAGVLVASQTWLDMIQKHLLNLLQSRGGASCSIFLSKAMHSGSLESWKSNTASQIVKNHDKFLEMFIHTFSIPLKCPRKLSWMEDSSSMLKHAFSILTHTKGQSTFKDKAGLSFYKVFISLFSCFFILHGRKQNRTGPLLQNRMSSRCDELCLTFASSGGTGVHLNALELEIAAKE